MPDLQLSLEQMREFGRAAVEAVSQNHHRLKDLPASTLASPEQMQQRFPLQLPQQGRAWQEVLDETLNHVFGPAMKTNHPRFFGFIPSPSNYVGAVADFLVAGFNPFAGTWLEAAGPSHLEEQLIAWLAGEMGLPDGSAGLFVSGGSAANMLGLAVAREQRGTGRVFFSDQTHSSVTRACRLLGLPDPCVLPSHEGQLCLEALEEALAAEPRPLAVVANAGTTNAGVVDPLTELGQFCREQGLWFHIDGAFGAAAALCAEGKTLLRGIELADSLVVDGHKWMFQPYEIGCLLVRDPAALKRAFAVLPDYLVDLLGPGVNFCDYGHQLTRSCRALKLWMTLQVFGLEAFRGAIAHGLELGRRLQQLVEQSSCWQLVSPSQLAVVAFRHRHLDDEGHRRLVQVCWRDGLVVVSSTRLKQRWCLRLCTIHPATDVADLQLALERLQSLAIDLQPPGCSI